MSLEQIMGELDRSGIPWTRKENILYCSRPERSKIEEANLQLLEGQHGLRLYFISKVEHYDRYAALIKKSVLGRELLETINPIITSTMHTPYHGGFIECENMEGVANVFKAFYEKPFTPIDGISQKEEITENVLEDDPDPDTITAQSL